MCGMVCNTWQAWPRKIRSHLPSDWFKIYSQVRLFMTSQMQKKWRTLSSNAQIIRICFFGQQFGHRFSGQLFHRLTHLLNGSPFWQILSSYRHFWAYVSNKLLNTWMPFIRLGALFFLGFTVYSAAHCGHFLLPLIHQLHHRHLNSSVKVHNAICNFNVIFAFLELFAQFLAVFRPNKFRGACSFFLASEMIPQRLISS